MKNEIVNTKFDYILTCAVFGTAMGYLLFKFI